MKMNKYTMKDKLKFQLIVSTGLIVVGCVLLLSGFWVVPVGIIDNSVLIAFGEILTFVGAVFGIDYSYKYKIFVKDKEEVKKKDKEEVKE